MEENKSKGKFIKSLSIILLILTIIALIIVIAVGVKTLLKPNEEGTTQTTETSNGKENNTQKVASTAEVEKAFKKKFADNLEAMQMIAFYHDELGNGKAFSDEAILHILPLIDNDTHYFNWDTGTMKKVDVQTLANMYFGRSINIPSKYIKQNELVEIDTPTGFGISSHDILSTKHIKGNEYSLEIRYTYGVSGEADYEQIVYIFTIEYNNGQIVFKTLEKKSEKTYNNETTKNTANNTETKTVKKQDASKDIVYDMYNENGKNYSYKVPYINLDSTDAKYINDTLKSEYKEKIEMSKKQENDGDIGYVKYNTYLNSNFLSIVIINSYQNDDYLSYTTYNFDIYTGSIVSNTHILAEKNISTSEFRLIVRDLIEKKFKENYKNLNNPEIYEKLFNDTMNQYESVYNTTDIPMFLDKEGKINVIGYIYALAGAGGYYTIINIGM